MLANVQRIMIMPTVHALFLFFFCSVLIHVLSTTRGHIDHGRNCAKSSINRINEAFLLRFTIEDDLILTKELRLERLLVQFNIFIKFNSIVIGKSLVRTGSETYSLYRSSSFFFKNHLSFIRFFFFSKIHNFFLLKST